MFGSTPKLELLMLLLIKGHAMKKLGEQFDEKMEQGGVFFYAMALVICFAVYLILTLAMLIF